MALPLDLLRDNNADVGALLSEKFLNHFADRHHAKGLAFYQGEYEINEFDRRVHIKYVVQNPIVFELSPIPTTKFSSIWLSHLKTKGATFYGHGTHLEDAVRDFTPPNLMVTSKAIKFIITVFKEDGAEDFSVSFEWNVEARCAVLLVDTPNGGKAIRLEPIKVEFSRPSNELYRDIVAALQAASQGRSATGLASPGQFGDPSDPVWCAKVEQLLLFIINQVLAIQLTNFLRELNLPRGLELHESVSVTPHYLGIQDSTLVAGAQVQHALDFDRQYTDEARAIMREFRRLYEQEMSQLSDENLPEWTADSSPSIQWLKAKRREVEAQVSWAKESIDKNAKSGYEQNIALVANDRLFDAVAKVFLNISEGETFEAELDFLVRAAAGYWFRVYGASGSVSPGGFNVSAQFDMGGFAEGCIPNPDPKHWGEWMCKRICIIFRTRPDDPFALNTTLNFWSRGIYGTFKLATQSFEFDFCQNLPWPISDFTNWFESIFGEVFTEFVRSVIALLQIKLYKYPRYFPGTALEWTPRMNSPAGNEAEFLVISGDPQFS